LKGCYFQLVPLYKWSLNYMLMTHHLLSMENNFFSNMVILLDKFKVTSKLEINDITKYWDIGKSSRVAHLKWIKEYSWVWENEKKYPSFLKRLLVWIWKQRTWKSFCWMNFFKSWIIGPSMSLIRWAFIINNVLLVKCYL